MLFRIIYNGSVIWVYSIRNEKYNVLFYVFYKGYWQWVDSSETIPYVPETDD